jgi:hypothetical protein
LRGTVRANQSAGQGSMSAKRFPAPLRTRCPLFGFALNRLLLRSSKWNRISITVIPYCENGSRRIRLMRGRLTFRKERDTRRAAELRPLGTVWESVPQPRLASKERTRTWGTRQHCRYTAPRSYSWPSSRVGAHRFPDVGPPWPSSENIENGKSPVRFANVGGRGRNIQAPFVSNAIRSSIC